MKSDEAIYINFTEPIKVLFNNMISVFVTGKNKGYRKTKVVNTDFVY
jgi:hypothetical protein